jgi:hypothetical protein
MPASERSFDGIGFCLDLAYTRRALGAAEMPFSVGLAIVCHMRQR